MTGGCLSRVYQIRTVSKSQSHSASTTSTPEHSYGKPDTVSMSPTSTSLPSIMEGNEVIAFHDAVLMQGGGTIEAKQIIHLFKSFQEVVRADMKDDEMSFLAEE
jgi:hypothetical protein